jgi:hypothetical protein
MGNRRLTSEELRTHLERQCKFLATSAALFDGGDDDESLRMAVAVRVLVHDTGQSSSVLGQIGLKEVLRYHDTSTRDLKRGARLLAALGDEAKGLKIVARALADSGLVEEDPATKTWVAPGVNADDDMVDFAQWWNSPCIETSSGRVLSRKQLVLMMANRAGGAHVDPDLDVDYADFVADTLGVMFAEVDGFYRRDEEPPSGWQHITGNVAAVTMRQIAAELIASLIE